MFLRDFQHDPSIRTCTNVRHPASGGKPSFKMLRPTKTHHSCADEELATIVTLLGANTSLGHVFSVWRVFLSMCWRACSPSKADRTSFVIACITDTMNALVPSLLFGIPPKELHGWLKDSVSLTCVWGLSVTKKDWNVFLPNQDYQT